MDTKDGSGGYLSSGGLAKALNVSRSSVKDWDRRGVIVPASRITGSGRRVWRVADLHTIAAQLRDHREHGRKARAA